MRWLPHIWDDELQTRYLSFDPLTAESFESATLSGEKEHVDSYAKFREKVNSIIAERKDPDVQAKWKNGGVQFLIIFFCLRPEKKRSAFCRCFPKMIRPWGFQQSFYMMNSIICRTFDSIS